MDTPIPPTAPSGSYPVETATPVEARVFDVLLSRRDGVEAGLVALAKRAVRKGLPVLAWSWGRAHTETIERLFRHASEAPTSARIIGTSECGVHMSFEVVRVPLTLPTEAPKYAGWTFAATLQHLDGENIVRSVPGQAMPTAYRSRGPVCDHCKASRRRNDTFVLRHDDGRFVQVGSTCIGDFLGTDAAGDIAAHACLLADAAGLAMGGEEEGGLGWGGGSGDHTLAEYLPIVAWVVRTVGWVSRTVARERAERDEPGSRASADYAWAIMVDPKARRESEIELSDEDKATGLAAEGWAEALTDADVDAQKGDYLHNLRVVARSGLVGHRTAGIAASMVTAHQRAVGAERARADRAARPTSNEHVGTVGKRETFLVTLDFVTGFETDYGYTTVLKFRTAAGATIVWKASSTEIGRSDVGKAYVLTGSVKKFDEYKGQKQTIVTRCALVEGTEVPAPVAKPKRARKAKAVVAPADAQPTDAAPAADDAGYAARYRGCND